MSDNQRSIGVPIGRRCRVRVRVRVRVLGRLAGALRQPHGKYLAFIDL